MSQFPPDTILTRTSPLGDEHDRLRVVGPSPVAASTNGEWEGASGEALIVTPADVFAQNLVMPTNYVVVHYTAVLPPTPSEVARTQPPMTPLSQQPTPEQIFAKEAHARKVAVPEPVDIVAQQRAAEQAAKLQADADRVAREAEVSTEKPNAVVAAKPKAKK